MKRKFKATSELHTNITHKRFSHNMTETNFKDRVHDRTTKYAMKHLEAEYSYKNSTEERKQNLKLKELEYEYINNADKRTQIQFFVKMGLKGLKAGITGFSIWSVLHSELNIDDIGNFLTTLVSNLT